MVLHVPNVPGGHYYEIQFLDPYTNDFAYVGTRATGDGAGTYVITGPGFHGRLPAGLKRIRSAYEHVWLCGRTLVKGPSDLPAVHKVQDGFRLLPLADYEAFGLGWTPPRPRKIITRHTDATVPTGLAYFDALGTALAQNPPPARDAAILREMARVGIGPGKHPSREHLSADVIAGLTAAANGGPAAIAGIRAGFAIKSIVSHNGWYVASADIGAYGIDYDLRAVVAVYGLGANRPVEAMYHRDRVHQPCAAEWVAPLRSALQRRPAPTSPLLLVADYVQPAVLPGFQPDQPLRDREPHRGREIQRRRLTRRLPPSHRTGRTRVQLAPQHNDGRV